MFPAMVVVLFFLRMFCFGVCRRWFCFGQQWWFHSLHVRLAFVHTGEFLICMLLQVGYWVVLVVWR
jgi:hypothetical protein